MKSTNKLIKIPIFLFFILSSYFVVGQCPIGVELSSNKNCLNLWWTTAPSSLPVTITYTSAVVGTKVFSYVSGLGISSNKANYNDGSSSGCNNYNPPLGVVTITYGTTVCIFTDGTLPLNLLDFKSATYDNSIMVSWKCIENEKCLGYELEKSYDGRQWNVLTFQSNSKPNTLSNYSFMDNQKSTNVIYYRLKKVNNDISFEYSNTITYLNNDHFRFSINPNPALNEITIVSNQLEQINKISCYDFTGKELNISVKDNNKIDITDFPNGVYYLNIETELNQYTEKFIKSDRNN